MKINSLEIKNFKGYNDEEIELFISSDELISRIKDDFLLKEIILFALYGELDYENFDNGKDFYICIEFELNNSVFKVIREFKTEKEKFYARFYENDEIMANGLEQTTNSVLRVLNSKNLIF